MADINARLKRALDGPAPQHKVAGEESFEVTEGSGGQLHVKDADVSAELAEIKRTQADILARLDGTINTQVTGSNVEDGIVVRNAIQPFETLVDNINVSAGSRISLNVRLSLFGLKELSLTSYCREKHEYEIELQWYPTKGTTQVRDKEYMTVTDIAFLSDVFKVKMTRGVCYLRNKDTENHAYEMTFYGR